MKILCVIKDTIGGGKYVLSVTGPDWKGNPHSIYPKRIHISYLIYNLIEHILNGYWSVHNVMVLSQLFGWVLSSHLSSWLLTWILSAQISWTTPAGSLNVTAFFTSPIGSCVYTIWLVFFLSFLLPAAASAECTAACTALSMHAQGLSTRELLARIPANTLM